MSLRERIVSMSEWIVERLKPAGPTQRPEEGRFISGVRDDYSIDLSSRRGLDPAALGDKMRAADEGDIAALMEVFEEVERDPVVNRLSFRRRLMVVGKSLLINEANETPQAKRSADLAREMIFGIDGHGGMAAIRQGLWDLSDAICKGFSVAQVIWRFDGGKFTPERLERWPQREFIFGDSMGQLFGRQQDHDELRVLTDAERVAGVPLSAFPPGQWIVHVQKAVSQPLGRAALMRSCAWYWLFKKFGMGDWSIFLERFGVPMRKGTYPPSAGKAERDALWQAVRALGKDHACIMPEGSSIELLELKGAMGGGPPHPALIGHCNEEISVAIMGSTMSTTQGERGARSAKEAFSDEEYEQTEHDAKNLAETIRQQLVAPLVAINLGPEYPVPLVAFQLDDDEDLAERSIVDARVQKMGFPITAGYIADRYGFVLPDGIEREDVLEPVAGGAPTTQSFSDEDREALLSLADSKKKSIRWVTSRS